MCMTYPLSGYIEILVPVVARCHAWMCGPNVQLLRIGAYLRSTCQQSDLCIEDSERVSHTSRDQERKSNFLTVSVSLTRSVQRSGVDMSKSPLAKNYSFHISTR